MYVLLLAKIAPCLAAYHQNSHVSKVDVSPISRISTVLLYTISLIAGKKQLGMQVQCWLLRELKTYTDMEEECLFGIFRLPLSCSCHYVKQFLIPCQGVQACHQHLHALLQDHASETDITTDEKSFKIINMFSWLHIVD